MTKNRKAMLDILESVGVPISASDMFVKIGEDADQATVYRTLHYLEEQGLAESFIIHCDSHGTQRYYTVSHHHWFHCEKCHRFTDLGNCKMDTLVREYEADNGIIINSHTLYLTGVCAKCQ